MGFVIINGAYFELLGFRLLGVVMYVCICQDINDHQINNAIHQGVDSLDKLKETLGVATCCGCCEPMVQDLLEDYHNHATAIDAMAI